MILKLSVTSYTKHGIGSFGDRAMLHRRPIVRTGHCKKCERESLHSHEAAGGEWLFHFLTFHLLPRIGVGNWVCVDCYSARKFLNVLGTVSNQGDSANSTFELDGNYLLKDYSLVRKSLRHCRYTTKFRDSIVDRLVNGQVDLPTIRSELHVRDSDVMTWIADRLNRQTEKIAQLTSLVEILASQQHNQLLESDIELETGAVTGDDECRTGEPLDVAGASSCDVQ